jgi:hypothetical protein
MNLLNFAFASISLNEVANVAVIVGAVVAIVTLAYTSYQIRQNSRIAKANSELELEKMFSMHDEVHLNLRPGGKWASGKAGPKTHEEWAKVEDYMGLFEHCELMLENKMIDWRMFKAIFGYRMNNILANEIIVQAKLVEEKNSWADFIKLARKLGLKVPS